MGVTVTCAMHAGLRSSHSTTAFVPDGDAVCVALAEVVPLDAADALGLSVAAERVDETDSSADGVAVARCENAEEVEAAGDAVGDDVAAERVDVVDAVATRDGRDEAEGEDVAAERVDVKDGDIVAEVLPLTEKDSDDCETVASGDVDAEVRGVVESDAQQVREQRRRRSLMLCTLRVLPPAPCAVVSYVGCGVRNGVRAPGIARAARAAGGAAAAAAPAADIYIPIVLKLLSPNPPRGAPKFRAR